MKNQRQRQCMSRFRALRLALGKSEATAANEVGSWRLIETGTQGVGVVQIEADGHARFVHGFCFNTASELARALETALATLNLYGEKKIGGEK